MKDYKEEFERLKRDNAEWCSFNLMNIGDRAMQAVARKQWIVARLFDNKRDLFNLQNEKANIKKSLVEKLIAKSPVNFDKTAINAIDNSPQMDQINSQIKDCEFLVSYLDNSVKMYSYIAQDIKNCLDARKLETEDY
jgi:hypothetical protein